MSKIHKIKWTPPQQQAVETVGRSVLVTASAGTGKTAVLSHRAVERIADVADSARADTMLVLTFTDAAAEEMRSRIAETLYKRYLQNHDSQLRQQLLLLDRAYISTIHSFCKRILTEFFYLIDLDPTFGILDADEQQLLKAELLEDILEQAWADDEMKEGLESLFAGRRVQPGTGSFVDLIIPLTEFLDSVISRDDFYISASAVCTDDDRPHEVLVNAQKEILLNKLRQCQDRLEYAMALDRRFCNSMYATSHIQQEIIPVVTACSEFLKKDKLDSCVDILSDLKFGQLRKKKDIALTSDQQALIKGPVDRVKKILKGLSGFALFCSDYQGRLATQATAQTKTLLKLMQMFDARYVQAKQRRNMLDFSDLEHCALLLLQSHPEVAGKLQERFDYIFVDEYQDINAPQQRILELVSRKDNVFVVGDIKQSIYGFRQSKPDIFLSQLETAGDISKHDSTPGRVDLKDNFRCRGEIIDFVNVLFRRTMTQSMAQMDYDSRAELASGFKYPDFKANDGPDKPVELVILDEQEAEPDSDSDDNASSSPTESVSAAQRQAAWIAQRIQKIVGVQIGKPEFQVYDKKTDAFRDVQYRDIVILMRSLSHKAQDYTEMLRLAGVPVHSQSACGYFETTEIADCLCLLKVLDNPDRDIELAALLRSLVFDVTDTQLSQIRQHAEKKSSFYQAVRQYTTDGPQDSLAEKLNHILSQISQWRRQVRAGSLADFLDGLFREKGHLSFYSALPNGAQRCANLLKLHDHAIQFEHFRTTEPGTALVRFVEFLEKLDEADQDWAPAEPGSSSQNAVRIMSIHKSKGLEFPVVFVAQLNSQFNNRDSSGQCLIDEDMLGLQIVDSDVSARFPSMFHQVIAERNYKSNVAEEMRILYVALTRAREKLILTGSKKQPSCQSLLRQCASFSGTIPDWKLTEAKCHLDWILAGFSNQSSLHTLFETGVQDGLCDDTLFCSNRVLRNDLDTMSTGILNAKRSLKSVTDPPKSGSNDDKTATNAFDTIQQNAAWQYRFSDITCLPAKLSVSKLTHRDDEFSDANMQQGFKLHPQVLSETLSAVSGKPDALTLGSAYHLIIEHLDLSRSVDADAVQKTVQNLINSTQLSDQLVDAVDISAITSFFDGPLGKIAQQAGGQVLREWPFTYALDAVTVGANSADEIVVMQGIIDMIIPTDDGLVIVDFKTDRVTGDAINERAEKYADQLRHYAKAAGDILKQPVTAAWLYFITPAKAFPVKLSE